METWREDALNTMRICGRCRCCSLEERRTYLARSGVRQWDSIVEFERCVGRCDVDGHTERSVEAHRAKLYAIQVPLRAAARANLAAAQDEYDDTIRDLDREYSQR